MCRLPSSERQPIFYDYSEDFEDVVETPPDYPIAPTPRRISSSLRSVIGEADCEASPESADEGVGSIIQYLRRATRIQDAENDEYCSGDQYRTVSQLIQRDESNQPDSYENAGDALASSPVLPELSHLIEDSFVSASVLDDSQDANTEEQMEGSDRFKKTIYTGMFCNISTTESPLEPETPASDIKLILTEPEEHDDAIAVPSECCDKVAGGTKDNTSAAKPVEKQMNQSKPVTIIVPRPDLASATSTTLPYRCSGGRKDSRLFSVSSGLSDLASLVNIIDKHMQTPHPEDDDRDEVSALPGSKSDLGSSLGRTRILNASETPAPPRKSSLGQYRRNPGGSPYTAPPVDELQQYQVVSTRSGPTLVPQPISPVKMLRVKNSIPQLMKALPPLPGYSPAPESPFGPAVVPIDFEPFEISRLTDARSTLTDVIVPKDRTEGALNGYDPFVFDRGSRKPKLKLKHAASLASGHLRDLRRGYREQPEFSEYSDNRPSTTVEYSTAPVKRRLPIKVSRPTLSSLASEDTGTVKRRPGFNNSSTVSDLTSTQPIDLFSASKGRRVALQSAGPGQAEQIILDVPEQTLGVTPRVTHLAQIQRVLADDNARGTSLDAQLDILHSRSAEMEAAGEGEMQSFFSENSVTRPRRGLRKRISNLRSRLTESRHHQRSPLETASHSDGGDVRGPLLGPEPPTTHSIKDLLSGISQSRGQHTVISTRKVRSKLEKFMKGAKHKLRAWGKHKRRFD